MTPRDASERRPSLIGDVQVFRRRFGTQLRSMRQRSGLTARDVARVSSLSETKINRLELSQAIATPDEVSMILDAIAATDDERWEVVTDMQTFSRTIPHSFEFIIGGSGRNLQDELKLLIESSSVIREMDSLVVPGLLQTAEYEKALHIANAVPLRDIEARLFGRGTRQQMLFDGSKRFKFVILEAALRHRHVAALELFVQHQRLITLSTLPNVDVGIVPFAVPFRFKADVCCVLYDDRYVGLDTDVGMIGSTLPEVIAGRREAFEYFSSQALHGDEARQFLNNLCADLRCEPVVDLRSEG